MWAVCPIYYIPGSRWDQILLVKIVKYIPGRFLCGPYVLFTIYLVPGSRWDQILFVKILIKYIPGRFLCGRMSYLLWSPVIYHAHTAHGLTTELH